MGNLQSIQCRTERRRSNRLSKPLTKKASLSPISPKSPATKSYVSAPVSPRPAPWKDPWSGTSIPISTSVSGSNDARSQSVPAMSFHPETPRNTVACTARNESIAEEGQAEHLHELPSPTFGNSSTSRRPSLQPSQRTSFQPGTSRSSSQSSYNPRQLKRSYSLQSPRARSSIYEKDLEEATSSNTYFMVDSQRFSITRRRSLLTRPGVATRQTTRQSVSRLSPPLGEDSERIERAKTSQLSSDKDGPVMQPTFSPGSTRPVTPSDFEYTHLGALKLGSLRVVNHSTPPCPSEQTREMPRNSSPRVSSEDVRSKESTVSERLGEANGQRLTKGSPSHVSGLKCQGVPASPFSFEKSATTVTSPNRSPYFAQSKDEELLTTNEFPINSDATLREVPPRKDSDGKLLRSLPKTDSGYNSATSSCSWQDECGLQNSPGSNNKLPMQRHLSLRNSRDRYPTTSSVNSSPSDGQSPWVSTCLYRMRQSQLNSDSCSSSLGSPGSLRRTASTARPYAPLNGIEFPVSNKEMLLFPQPPHLKSTRGRGPRASFDEPASKPSSVRRKMATLEEKDCARSGDRTEGQHLEKQLKFARPIKRREFYMAKSPFIFH